MVEEEISIKSGSYGTTENFSYLVVKVFVLKLFPIDTLPTSSILVGKVTALDHEVLDDCQKKSGS